MEKEFFMEFFITFSNYEKLIRVETYF